MRMEVWLPPMLSFISAALVASTGAEHPVLRLERAWSKNASMEHLIAMDHRRHVRQGLLDPGVVQLPVTGTGYQFLRMNEGGYLTRAELGNPPRSFDVLIDTGSDLPWVACSDCVDGPKANGPNAQSAFFDPGSSSTASVLTCSDERCHDVAKKGGALCMNNSCSYYQDYGDGYASTTGFFVSDMVKLDVFKGNETSSISVPIIFGCSHLQSGGLTDQYKFDGIFGFGPSPMSFNSQLQSLGLSRKVFSLCMKSYGGGILVLGKVVEPGLVYTPLLPLTSHYGLNLEGIAVNGIFLLIEPSVFEQSHGYHTIADSGTTLAFLADNAFDPFVTAIASAVSQSVRPIIRNGVQCFITSGSVEVSFPTVTLYFAGAAVMQLKPHNYLVLSDDQLAYCIAWQRGKQLTILGDIILMDKIIVHDIENMRLGWVDYDCSHPVNITTSSGTRHGHIYTFSIVIWCIWCMYSCRY